MQAARKLAHLKPELSVPRFVQVGAKERQAGTGRAIRHQN